MQLRIYPTISITAQESDVTQPIPGQLYYFSGNKTLAVGVSPTAGRPAIQKLQYVQDITVSGTSIGQNGVVELGNRWLPLSGGVMQGNIDIQSNNIVTGG